LFPQQGRVALALLRPAGFEDFRKKRPKSTWLCVGISPVSATDAVKSLKDATSLVASTQEKLFGWGLRIFCERRRK